MHRKDLSVRTPSIAGTIISKGNRNQAQNYVHVSNPNPQHGSKQFNGIRDQGYNSAHASPANATGKAGLSLIHTPSLSHKFGKRVFMGNYQMSDKDVFDLHMQQIKSKGSLQNFEREVKIKEEQEFTRFV